MLGLSDLNSLFMSDKDASLKENVRSFATLLCIKKVLGWFLNLSIALLAASIMSLLLSTMYVFSVIPRFFVAFLKKLFISSATTSSLDSLSSFSFTSAILSTVFPFFWKERLNVSPECFLFSYFTRIYAFKKKFSLSFV